MTRAARWTSSRGIALGIAADYRIPRLDADDVRQEALVALWEATGVFDAGRGSWPGFARLVVHRHLTDMLRAATTVARRAPTVELDPERDEDRTVRDRMEYRLEIATSSRSAAEPTGVFATLGPLARALARLDSETTE